jgi:DNA replication protein DnaC
MCAKKNTKIDETLQKIAAGMSKASTPTSSSTETASASAAPPAALSGDPACPICQGLGYYRLDLPVGHPEFGRLHICSCRQAQVSQQVRQRLFRLSQLDELSHLTFENFA